jgi:DNA repair photolyase
VVGVNAIPILPFISDTEEELEKIISAAKKHGADYILIGGLTIFGNAKADSKTLYYKFLERYNAALLPKYEELYGNNFYAPYYCQDKLKQRAKKLCEEYGIRNSILD